MSFIFIFFRTKKKNESSSTNGVVLFLIMSKEYLLSCKFVVVGSRSFFVVAMLNIIIVPLSMSKISPLRFHVSDQATSPHDLFYPILFHLLPKKFTFFHLPLKPNTHDDMTKAVYFHIHNIT